MSVIGGYGYGGYGRGFGGYGYGGYGRGGYGYGRGYYGGYYPFGYGFGYGRGYGGYGYGLGFNSYGSSSAYGSSGYVLDSAGYFASGASAYYSPSTPAAVSPAPAVADTAVILSVRVPADAEIWFNGARTHLTGASREFVSPPLTPGHDGTYELRARWEEDGRQVERTRQVTVRAGDRLNINFLSPS